MKKKQTTPTNFQLDPPDLPSYNEPMEQQFSSKLSLVFGLLLGAVFLYFTFRGMDLGLMRQTLQTLRPWTLAGLVVLGALALWVRSLRWYGLLAPPRLKGELLACQRALAVSYGVNNLASRVGEVVRVVMFSRDTGRSYASVTATLLADRILFDSLFFAGLVVFSLVGFGGPLLETFPQLARVMPVFIAICAVAIAGMAVLGARPIYLKKLALALGISRWPVIWKRLEPLIDQLSLGLVALTRPRQLVLLHSLNVIVWGLSYLSFKLCLDAFGIEADFQKSVLVFTVSSFGFLLPSPGGVGTFHYFMTLACTTFLASDKTQAAAAATVFHGVNYLVLSAAALGFFFVKPGCRSEANLKANPISE